MTSSILWIEDEPEKKLSLFRKYFKELGRSFDREDYSNYTRQEARKKIKEDLSQVGITLILNLREITDCIVCYQGNYYSTFKSYFQNENTEFPFKLIFCDINLLGEKKEPFYDKKRHDDIERYANQKLLDRKEGAFLFNTLCGACSSDKNERKLLIESFYFLSVNNWELIRAQVQQNIAETEDENWQKKHFLLNDTGNSNQESMFSDFPQIYSNLNDGAWTPESNEWYTHPDFNANDGNYAFVDVSAQKKEGKWIISFEKTDYDSIHEPIHLEQDVHFHYNRPKQKEKIEERILKIIKNHPKNMVKIKYHDILNWLTEEDDGNIWQDHFEEVLLTKERNNLKKCFLREMILLRLFTEKLRKKINTTIYPTEGTLKSDMEKRKDFCIHCQEKSCKVLEKINRCLDSVEDKKGANTQKQKKYNYFDSYDLLYLTCPEYVAKTFQWVYPILSAYYMHTEQQEHEGKQFKKILQGHQEYNDEVKQKIYESSQFIWDDKANFLAALSALEVLIRFYLSLKNKPFAIENARNFIPYDCKKYREK